MTRVTERDMGYMGHFTTLSSTEKYKVNKGVEEMTHIAHIL